MTRGPRTHATHHNAETQAQGASEKATAFFDTEVALPWQHADEDIAADDGGTDDTSWRRRVFARSATIARDGRNGEQTSGHMERRTYAADDAQYPPASVIVEFSRHQGHLGTSTSQPKSV